MTDGLSAARARDHIGYLTRAHFRSHRFRFWLIVLIITAGAMAFTPLFHLLGFGFSFVVALVASVACLDLSSAFIRRLARAPTAEVAPSPLVRAALTGVIKTHLGLLLAPLAVISANGLRVRNCDWLFGLEAYLLMPGLSVMLATALGLFVGLLFHRRRWLTHVAPYLVFALAVAHALWRFYAAPPVFSYNLFTGYFPGNLYDENIALRAPFYWARVYQFGLVLGLLFAATTWLDSATLRLTWRPTWTRSRLRVGALAALALVLAGWLGSRSAALGFDIDADDIRKHLAGRYETEHFVIHYPPGGEIDRDIAKIAEDHEYRYAQVVRVLGAESDGPITSFYFASAADKYRMMGAGRVYMAKPWRKEIYLHHSGFPHQVLRHEIAHVVAGNFGAPVFRVSADSVFGLPVVFNVGLIEGIAVAADWPDHFTRALTPHQSVKAMLELGMAPPVSSVLSTGFLAFSSARSYTLAGSFVRYLLDTHGAARLRELYRSGGDFRAAYGRSQSAMVAEWRAMIDTVELPPRAAEIVRERFRRPGIFARPCPHAIARAQVRQAAKLARGDVRGAIAIARRVCSQAPHEPRYLLGLADLLVQADRDDEAATIYRRLMENDQEISSSLRAEATSELVAMAARAGDLDEARRLLRSALALPLDDGTRRFIEAQLFVLDHDGPAGKPLRDYFWAHDPRLGADPMVLLGRAAAAITAEPTLGLGHYLLGRNLRGRGAPEDATRALARALELGLPSPLLRREAARLLAEAAYLAGDHPRVEQAALILLEPGQSAVTRLYGADWLERLYWKRNGRLPAPRSP